MLERAELKIYGIVLLFLLLLELGWLGQGQGQVGQRGDERSWGGG